MYGVLEKDRSAVSRSGHGRGVWLTTKRSKEGFDGNVLYLSWGTGDMIVSICQNS